MRHIFHRGENPASPTLLLLHGTGGTERDLIPLAQRIEPGASYLSVRGNVLENGMPRYFRRLAEGVFDLEDLVFRTHELNDFLRNAAEKHQFDRNRVIAIGYSNGANIAASLMFHISDAFMGAILHHPMVPIRGVALPEMTGTPIFIGAGKNDPICSVQETEELSGLLSGAGAHVNVHWEQQGHQLTGSEVNAARAWYQEKFAEKIDNGK